MVVVAAAADLPQAAPAAMYSKALVPSPEWNWTGFYVGVQGGAGQGTTQDSETALQNCIAGPCAGVAVISPPGFLQNSYTMNGLHGGGTAGFNWQTGRLAFGVEGDISGANIAGTSSGLTAGVSGSGCANSFTSLPGTNVLCHTKMPWFATAAGRLGVTFHDTLLYVKGGAAWGHFDQDVTAANVNVIPVNVLSAASVASNRLGYTVGAGIEYALWNNWSAKFEYDYMDFGTHNVTFAFTGPALLGGPGQFKFFNDERASVHIVRAGLNYRFDWGGPVVAKY